MRVGAIPFSLAPFALVLAVPLVLALVLATALELGAPALFVPAVPAPDDCAPGLVPAVLELALGLEGVSSGAGRRLPRSALPSSIACFFAFSSVAFPVVVAAFSGAPPVPLV